MTAHGLPGPGSHPDRVGCAGRPTVTSSIDAYQRMADQNAEVLPSVVGNECAVPMMRRTDETSAVSGRPRRADLGVDWQGNRAS